MKKNSIKKSFPPEEWLAFNKKFKIFNNRGVTFPKGFLVSAVNSGIKKNRSDLVLIISEKESVAAGVFTTNRVQAAPVQFCKKNIKNSINGILINSGCANSYTGKKGEEDIISILSELSQKWFGLNFNNFLMASTGVIGTRLPVKKIKRALPVLISNLQSNNNADIKAAKGIMTTDTVYKTVATSFYIGNKEVRIGAMAKGAGMISPNMATMLVFVTTDVSISRKCLQEALKETIEQSFNRISVDGDTSTNDSVIILANAKSENRIISSKNHDYKIFCEHLLYIFKILAWKIVSDGEGVTKVFLVKVKNAKDKKDAEKVCRTIANSLLVKTAVFGEDFNWGRIVNAIGYSNASFNPERLDLSISDLYIIKKGRFQKQNEKKLEKIFKKNFFTVNVNLNASKDKRAESMILTTDLSYDYIKINADYRS